MPRRTTHPTPRPSSSATPATFTDSLPLPKILVFDLDYTLWPFWVDTHVSGSFKPLADNTGATDRTGQTFAFYDEVPGILAAASERGVAMSLASRTHAPDLARRLLEIIRVSVGSDAGGAAGGEETVKAWDFFQHRQIFPGDKKTHMRNIKKAAGVEFDDILFFDDEERNMNVEALGVKFVLVRDGVSCKEIDRGVEEWRRRNAVAR